MKKNGRKRENKGKKKKEKKKKRKRKEEKSNKKRKRGTFWQKQEGVSEKEREREERGRERNIISKIYENQTVGFRWSKRKSRSTYRELRVGTKILEFHQTPQGRKFSYLKYFKPKGHLMAWGFL